MAPIKFEEQIKDKLEKRSLSPSNNSWAKLSERLDAEKKKPKRPIYWWLSVAAGLVILVAVSIQFFNNDDGEFTTPAIVEETQTEIEPKIENKDAIVEENQDKIEDETEIDGEDSKNSEAPKIIEFKKTIKNKPKTQLAETENKEMKIPNNEGVQQFNNELKEVTEEDLLKEAMASAMQDLKSENSGVTDKEIDSLLKVASKELFRDKIKKETSKTVDAEALLLSVEDEMGQSFRSKVFEALKTSYETVKTAVAERNN